MDRHIITKNDLNNELMTWRLRIARSCIKNPSPLTRRDVLESRSSYITEKVRNTVLDTNNTLVRRMSAFPSSSVYVLQTAHILGHTSLGMVTLDLSLSWVELEPLLSHDHAHARNGSPGQACSRIVLVHQIHIACIGFSSSSIFYVP